MKKIFYTITLFALLGTLFASCKKFLEKEPIGRIGKQVLFEDVNGAQLAINGSYNLILSYYKNEFGMYADVASDNLIRSTKTSIMLSQFDFKSTPDEDAATVGHIWLNIFEALNNVNNVLNAIPALKTQFPDQAKKLDSLNAQGLVMRALCHFDLSRTYAQPYNFTADASHPGVPIILKTPSPGQTIERKTMKETYDQIIADINEALPTLQRYSFRTTAAAISYQSAIALLSRIYLYKGDWAQSIAYADIVIKDSGYKLAIANNYKSAFITYTPNTDVKEENLLQLTNAGITINSSNIYTIFSDAGSAQYTASSKILNLFDNDDIRKKMFTNPKSGENAGKFITKKYADSLVNIVVPLSVKVIRLSEVYLNRAEAKWNLGKYSEAASDIQIISQRAHPDRIINITYNSDPGQLYKQIADERNRELCFEGHRFFDIARRKENLQRGIDCNAAQCTLNYPNDKFALPISAKEIDANKGMKQNPGYN